MTETTSELQALAFKLHQEICEIEEELERRETVLDEIDNIKLQTESLAEECIAIDSNIDALINRADKIDETIILNFARLADLYELV